MLFFGVGELPAVRDAAIHQDVFMKVGIVHAIFQNRDHAEEIAGTVQRLTLVEFPLRQTNIIPHSHGQEDRIADP